MIIDAHVHLVTSRMIGGAKKRFDSFFPGIIDKTIARGTGLVNEEMIAFLQEQTVESLAALWIEQLDTHKIDRAYFLPIAGTGVGEIDEFCALHPDRFSGYFFVDDPHKKSALIQLRRHAISGRIRGIKLYPSLSHVSVADKRLFPLYEEAAALKMPVLIHFGITTAPIADYRYTNPLDLQLPAKLFPETNFMVAHFGAGFFRELLLLGFHANNIYVDTSGTNNWRLYLPAVMPLVDVFRRTIEVYGAGRIVYGTDSMISGLASYRTFVLNEQKAALAALKLKKDEKEAIMGGNAARLFGHA
jgi:hypothetical protein